VALAVAAALPAGAQTAYLTTFEGGAGAEWSSQKTGVTPAGARRFLGPFNNDTVTLSLKDLPAHNGLRISFDLYLIRSWNGSSPGAGPDVWDASVAGGTTLLHTTFSTYADGIQNYPGEYPGASGPGLAGADEVNTLGYIFDQRPRDAVYHLTFDLYHPDPTLALRFSLQTPKTLAEAAWGLDNVRVDLSALPTPPPPAENLVVNGDFESPYLTGPQALVTYTAPSTDIPGWTVSAGTLDLNGLYWENASGRQSLDMSGQDVAGTLTQDLPTIPGKTYVLDFAMAGNPGGPPLKEMDVLWNGARVDRATFENSAATTEEAMGWTRKQYVVSVPSSAAGPTTLAFQSLTPGSFGPALDDVRVLPEVPGEAGMNSEFELPEALTGGTVYGQYEGFEDWVVMQGDVRQVRDGWAAAGGRQFLLLNETGPGSVAQSVHTTTGQAYLIRFAMAGDPRGGPAEKDMQVTWDGHPVGGIQTFDTTGRTQSEMGWQGRAFLVQAASGLTDLGFESRTAGANGPALDAASAAPVAPGDADGDGVMDLPDAVLALRQVTGADPPSAAVRALTDLVPSAGTDGRLHGDGTLTFADVVAVLRIANNLEG
jgi:choice-of-anchor C domain-containing protein